MKTRTNPHRRQELIAIASIIGSGTAAVFASYLLVIGLTPGAQQAITPVVPSVFGLDPTTVAALVPAACVSAGPTLAIGLETAYQLSTIHATRVSLEERVLEEPE